MQSFFRKPVIVFFIAMIVVSAICFLIPLNLFDGEYTFSMNGITWTEKANMSLSYFIGIGASPKDLESVVSFRLLPMGYLLAGLLLIGFPALIAYRVHLANQQKQ